VTQNAGGLYTDQLYYPWWQFWTYRVIQYPARFAGMQRVEPYASDTYPTPNRIYSGNYGRWLSPDPLGLKAANPANPQTWNLYAYVANNPTTLTDPTGLRMSLTGCGALDIGCGGGGGGEPVCLTCDGGLNPALGLGEALVDGTPMDSGAAGLLLGSGAAVDVTGIDTSPKHDQSGWWHFGCFADGSCGFMPSSLAGYSPRDVANALALVQSAQQGLASPVDPSKLTGGAADAYRLLLGLGVDPSAMRIYQASGGSFEAVLTSAAFAALQQSQIASHPFDDFLHYPYTSAARDLNPTNSLHLIWFDPSLTNFVGGAGVYMQFHPDADNPWTGSFTRHMECTVFKVGCS
jgi:RHS repeat-associated protein